jgi:hypothetical protein
MASFLILVYVLCEGVLQLKIFVIEQSWGGQIRVLTDRSKSSQV